MLVSVQHVNIENDNKMPQNTGAQIVCCLIVFVFHFSDKKLTITYMLYHITYTVLHRSIDKTLLNELHGPTYLHVYTMDVRYML